MFFLQQRAHTLSVFILTLMTTTPTLAASSPTPPVAAKQAWQESRHGEIVADDYHWLREKTNPKVIAYLKAENAYTEAMTKDLAPLAKTLYGEMKGRMKETDLSVPTRRGKFYYYSRTEAGQQYPIICRRLAKTDADFSYDAEAPEEVLLDENQLAKGKKFFQVESFAISLDHRYLAYSTDTTGYRQYQLHVKDLSSGKLLADSVERVTSVAWAADSQTLFLVQEDATTKRSDLLLRLKLGSKPVEVYRETNEQFNIGVGNTSDRKFVELEAQSTDTTEVSLLAADQPQGSFRSVLGRESGHRYHVDHRDGELFILTNKDAKNFRLVTAPLATPDQTHWKELIAHDPNVLLEGIELFRDFLVVSEKSDAQERSRIYDFASRSWKTVQFDEAVYTSHAGGTPEFTSSQYRLMYQSPVTPPTVFDVDMASGKRQLLKQQEVPGYNPALYETKRLWATARDGVKVPLWTVARKDVKLDGSAPLLLYAYGSYGIPAEATFSNSRVSLLDRGVVFAEAHIRGGNDMGEHWHDDGMLMNKKNTFNDFIDSAEYLVQQGWTSPQRLIIEGGSAGGLLMGAVTNMRPDLFHAVHAAVPFVDVMNTMMDASLPLTTGEYLEWGNPNEKAAYDYMRSYSPYDNIARKDYPAMLVTTGLNDSQVMYWEPAKYTAKLRALKTDHNPLLLKVNMGAGHGGASGRYDAIKERSFEMAWMLSQWGITPSGKK
ncbi:prolyl oligopeptidase family protein [Collimonas pratensis]|uniref:Prolyl oligopeptidase family protein n=2 Tax=Collimonas pratensis TaxID=279113 RepID=A0ABM5Z0G6_9BURK|nr:prolyl oligopeptidase family protein [Collimonas pratensis]